jgi:hypothetical protein
MVDTKLSSDKKLARFDVVPAKTATQLNFRDVCRSQRRIHWKRNASIPKFFARSNCDSSKNNTSHFCEQERKKLSSCCMTLSAASRAWTSMVRLVSFELPLSPATTVRKSNSSENTSVVFFGFHSSRSTYMGPQRHKRQLVSSSLSSIFLNSYKAWSCPFRWTE